MRLSLATKYAAVIVTFLSSSCVGLQQVGRVKAGPIEISRLGCGTWSWGNRILWDYDISQDEEIYEAYQLIRNAGVTIFDTADSYGTLDLNGRAEVLLGEFERRYQQDKQPQQQTLSLGSLFSSGNSKSSRKNAQQVATKFAPYPWRITRGSMVRAAEASLERLGQSKLGIAQLHWSTSKYQPFQERAIVEGLADVYDAGLCEAVGVSNYGPIQLSKVADRMKERDVPLASAQIQYSLMTYGQAKDMTEACDDAGCRLISYSPLCLGLLTGKYSLEKLPKGPRRQLFLELLPGAQDLLSTLDAVAAEYGKTQTQIAINWAMAKGTVPIPGCRTLTQAQQNLDAARFTMRQDAIDELDRMALGVKKPMIQNVFQTQ